MEVNKYQAILNDHNKKDWVLLSKIFDDTILYVKEKHNDRDQFNKIASVYVVSLIYLMTTDFNVDNINEYVDTFFKYYDEEYTNYINSFELISDKFNADICFYGIFVKDKKYLNYETKT